MSEIIDNENKTEHKSHHSHHRTSGNSHRSGSGHHHSHSKKYYKSHHEDPTSIMERMGKNLIYDNVRKQRISLMIKRSVFCLVVLGLIAFSVYFLTSSDGTYKESGLFNKGISTEEANELNNKLVDYEEYIEELEERLSKYEEVEFKFYKPKMQDE